MDMAAVSPVSYPVKQLMELHIHMDKQSNIITHMQSTYVYVYGTPTIHTSEKRQIIIYVH